MMKYKLLVESEDGKWVTVKLPSEHKWAFIERFGLMKPPTEREFEEWLTIYEAYLTVSEYEDSFERFFNEVKRKENEKSEVNSTP